jgi:hypothetical protein
MPCLGLLSCPDRPLPRLPAVLACFSCCSILLDDKWRVKIANFGLSRVCTFNQACVSGIGTGTPGAECCTCAGCATCVGML